MNANELRSKTPSELEETLQELLKEQFNLRMQQGTGQLARPHMMGEVRKNIARVKTVLNEMQSGDAS
ncbi:50S ribosomal protein L29 [Solemya velum gill symbiont]|uniref:Large ribosomal subunit protein uL29 n=1 Tax=Solemya velum gill symbiont TaxID=2340 RepID=A0A0B0HC45_SOVGS|nr:50S ribosomal protein L29 [Solemya velum gill symbiont]KHF25434.1 LSU ribosomal protein L29P [Solemya velum gill symbiont]OOY34353.1 50S ribosomal protein L29 [Solemya velum gill symbiont]OOY37003.1 50S ribosomal protein L29 [Solemya velum gill symbiont]OOY39864.1 50S ribosomal protein L29 [Solemya velum gill symbiont]OOY43127.1 50S ribosomal protein L29 [Solemya velum gill symbiont]